MERLEAVVVGAGHAGLAASRQLGGHGVEHAVLERARVAERWRSERWDSFTLLTPNWASWLPGWRYAGDDPGGFMTRDEVVSYIEGFARSFDAPVREGVDVRSLESANGDGFLLRTSAGEIAARSVVLATGPFQAPKLPPWASRLADGVFSLHSSAYRSAEALPDGGVLVVGSGASGLQIVEDLLRARRDVHVSVGRNRAVPRRYRGHDYIWWRERGGWYELTAADVPPAQRRHTVSEALTGFEGGHDLELRRLHAGGATLLGRVLDADGARLSLGTGLARSLAEGDGGWTAFTDWVEERLDRFDGVYDDAVPRERLPDPPESPAELDLRDAGIATVLFATGFAPDYASWVRLPVFDAGGEPLHARGATSCPGLYVLGRNWLHRARSPFIRGAEEDATHVAALVAARAAA